MSVSAREGAHVAANDPVLTIAPDPDFVYEALRGLLFVGNEEDLPDVERYAQGVAGMPERIKIQAAETAKAIRSRSKQQSSSNR